MMLRDDGYKYGLPYWNSGLERGLPSPAHSAIFTKTELGVSRTANQFTFKFVALSDRASLD